MSFTGSYTEVKPNDFSSPGVSKYKSETELGNEKEDYSEPEGPYTDKPLAD